MSSSSSSANLPAEFDARRYCQVGDVLQPSYAWDYECTWVEGGYFGKEGVVTKVTRCFVTYEISENGRETKTNRGKVTYVERPLGQSYIRVGGQGDNVWMEKHV